MLRKSLVLIVLCAVLIQAMPTSRRQRCLCRSKELIDSVNIRNVAKVEFHPPSSSCDQEELVVTFKRRGHTRCLNINSQQGRTIKEAIMKKKK